MNASTVDVLKAILRDERAGDESARKRIARSVQDLSAQSAALERGLKRAAEIESDLAAAGIDPNEKAPSAFDECVVSLTG